VSRWRFILSGRWVRWFLFALAFAGACAGLASWQMARHDEKVTEVHRIEANYDASPVPLEKELPRAGDYSPDDEWQPVAMTGQYRAADQLLVRNRPRDGYVSAGFEVLVPFAADSGRLFLIDRGWVPVGKDPSAPDSIPAPPAGTVTVVARLKQGEPSVPGGTTASGVLASIQLDEVARVLGEPVDTGAYGLLDTEDPAPADRPLPAARPQLDEGPHLSYVFQWIGFGLLGFAGLAFGIRQEYRYRNADHPEEQRKAAAREAKRASRRDDADEEDALLDSTR
jgi:cytochrome oxidase assembly protein ShyY1